MERRIASPTITITRRQMTLVFCALALLCVAAFTIGVLAGKSVAVCPDCQNDALSRQAVSGDKQTEPKSDNKPQASGEKPKAPPTQPPQQNVQPPATGLNSSPNPNLSQTGQPKSKEELAALEMAGGAAGDSKKQPDAKIEDKGKKGATDAEKKQTDDASADDSEKPPKQDGPFTVQLSAHVKKDQAQDALKNLGTIEGLTPFIVEAKSNGVKVYRIQIGKFQTKEEAKKFAETIAANKSIMGNVVPFGKK